MQTLLDRAEFPRIRNLDDPSWSPFNLGSDAHGDVDDPYPLIHQLRREAPVHALEYRQLFEARAYDPFKGLEHFSVFGYDALVKVLTDPATFSNEALRRILGISFGRSISTMDPPEHTRYRRIFQAAFLPQIVSTWGETFVQPVVDRLMGQFLERGEADLVQAFTLHYPFGVIYEQLGLPEDDTPIFHKMAAAQTLAPMGVKEGAESTEKLQAYFQRLVEYRRSHPGKDLVSHLVQVEVDGEKLPDEVVVSFLRQLVNAGGDTTYRATSVLLVGLLSDPEQLAAVQADRSLVAQAIDEAIRWEGPVLASYRTAARDVELEGVKIPQGAVLNIVLGGGNRDETRYENPDKFDIFRGRTTRHLGFATGPHVCIGQHLARVEMTRALNALLDRLRNLRLDPGKPPPKIRGCTLRVPKHLHVRFDPA